MQLWVMGKKEAHRRKQVADYENNNQILETIPE